MNIGVDGLKLNLPLARLRRPVAPGRDLWPGIEARLDHGRGGRRPRVLALAAGLLVAGVAVWQVWGLLGSDAPRDDAALAFVEAEYAPGREQQRAQLRRRLVTLPPGVQAEIRRNLAVIDQAQAQIRDLLIRHPGDGDGLDALLRTYEWEQEFMQTIDQLLRTSI